MKTRSNKQSKLKTIIMTCFLLMSFSLIHAQQPYKFKTEEQSGLFICTTKGEGYGVNENTFCGDFTLGSSKERSVGLIWGLFPKDKDTGIDLFLMEEKGITVKFQLSNGEIFEIDNPNRTGQVYWFGASSSLFKSNKTSKQNTFEAGSYFIAQLRKYNITKISISDRSNHRVEFATNGFRSAVTIDAMCKALMAKTGNQGQYGSLSNNNSPGNSSQPNTTAPRVSSLCPNNLHPHAIDLGLPSGTKWSCCNVGASKPENYGAYNSWGPAKGPAKLPSIYDFKELLSHCSFKFTNYNGVNGAMFTGPNGNRVFFPATGYKLNNRYDSQGEYGNYWSDTLLSGDNYNAFNLSFDKDRVVYDDFTSRNYQLSMRLIVK